MTERGNTQSGLTFVELMVAATLMSLFALFLAPAGQTLHRMLEEVDGRTESYLGAQLAQVRFFSDAKAASSVDCVVGERVAMTLTTPAGTLVEYRRDGDRFIRWAAPPDKDFLVTDGLAGLSCVSTGADALTVDLDFGGERNPLHLTMVVADVESVP